MASKDFLSLVNQCSSVLFDRTFESVVAWFCLDENEQEVLQRRNGTSIISSALTFRLRNVEILRLLLLFLAELQAKFSSSCLQVITKL